MTIKGDRPDGLGSPIPKSLLSRLVEGVRYVVSGDVPDWFGPMQPIEPIAQEAAEGRQFDYPVGYNLRIQPRDEEPISFYQLRMLAEHYDLLRLVIETRKDQIVKLDWAIQLLDEQTKTTDEQQTRIDELTALFRYPDQEHHWESWLRMLLEDMLVIDAACIYPRWNRAGGIFGFELIDGACYSDDTEVLTRRGWLRFDQIDMRQDEFATRDLKTKSFEWQRATYFHQVHFAGPMHHFHSRAVDLLVSPNHRMLVTGLPRTLGGSRHRKGEAVLTAAEFSQHCERKAQAIPMTSTWTGEPVPSITFSSKKGARYTITMTGDQYCAFMGMYLAEGSGNARSAYISQIPSGRGFTAYRDLLKQIYRHDPCYTGTNFVLGPSALRDHVLQFGTARNKFIPSNILNATPHQLALFWKYFALGDGDASRDRMHTSSQVMADQLVEIAQKMGRSASVSIKKPHVSSLKGRAIMATGPQYVVNVRTTASMLVRHESIPYDGMIRCVSVPNEFLYVRRNGKPAWCGNTIKRVLNEDGRTPQPPDTAYQQVLKGVPAVDYSMDELVYLPRNVRTWKIYGFSPTEQILMTVNIALRRQMHILQYFTEGNIPEALMGLPMSWTPDQIKTFQKYWDDLIEGNTAVRRHLRFVPSDVAKTYVPLKEPALKDEFDEWLARIVCFAFSISPTAFIKQMNRACYSSDTETLTEHGWKRFEDIQPSERIATVNPKTGQMEYHQPIERHVYPYEGEMVRVKTRGVDVLVTPDHDLWVRGDRSPQYRKRHADRLFQRQMYVVATAPYVDGSSQRFFDLPHRQQKYSRDGGDLKIRMDDWLELLGFYLSEGGLSHRHGHYLFTLAQKVGATAERIDALLHRLPFSFSRYPRLDTGVQRWNVYGQQLCDWLKTHAGGRSHDKHIPRQFLDLSPHQLRILFDALMAGDGSRDRRPHRTAAAYYTTSSQLADDVQELALKLGYSAKLTIHYEAHGNRQRAYRILMCARQEHSIRPTPQQCTPSSLSREAYRGSVYCFHVPNHLFITRRNGCIGIHGNTAETQKEEAKEEGLVPIMRWVKNTINLLIHRYLKQPDLEFVWKSEEATDPVEQATINTEYVKAGVLSIDEVRSDLGKDPVGATTPMVLTASGYTTIEPKALSASSEAGKVAKVAQKKSLRSY